MSRFPAYRSTYHSRHGVFGQHDIDSSTHSDGSSMMDVSVRSHQNFLESRDKNLDMESDSWPAPLGLGEEEEEEDGEDTGEQGHQHQHAHVYTHPIRLQ
jgi:hypothetical protein